MKAHIFKTRGFSKTKEWALYLTADASLVGAAPVAVSADKRALKTLAKERGAVAHNY